MYSSGMPILLLLGFLALTSRYFSQKYLILNESVRVSGLN